MTDYSIEIERFLDQSATIPVMDVRSPAEFAHGHFPGSHNLPLFSNEERAAIGTLYNRKGGTEAMMKGLEIVGPRMRQYVEEALRISPSRELLLYCWRGGMRSNSLAWLYTLSGIRTQTLSGGYKAYRRYVHEFFSRPLNLIVLGGMTGSGKTVALETLERNGQQVIHLERLASHKGSVFGHLGMPAQPSAEQFENDLFEVIRGLDPELDIFIEDESLAIGNVFIPKPLYQQMSQARFVLVSVPFKKRVKFLVAEYAQGASAKLIEAVKRIERRLGSELTRNTIRLIEENCMEEAVGRILHYYDKLYTRSMNQHSRKVTFLVQSDPEKPGLIAERILQGLNIPQLVATKTR